MIKYILLLFILVSGFSLDARNPDRYTVVSITENQFFINGELTYSGRYWNGHKIEGLLLNARMVQGIFDDLNPETKSLWTYPDTKTWDPGRNTKEFVEAMPGWKKHGLLAFTINLQGGSPYGYSKTQPWDNSAIREDGTLKEEYMARLEKILDKADKLGMVAILGIFYFGQDERVKDEQAVIVAVENTIDWLFEKGYRNVLIEICNETMVWAYDHDILKPDRVHEVIQRVKERKQDNYRYLVSTSYGGGEIPSGKVIEISDFILAHGNNVNEPVGITRMIADIKKVPGYKNQPILFNEDDHYDFDRPGNNFVNAIKGYASWGFFDYRVEGEEVKDGYQSIPVDWKISSERKKSFFNKLKEITGE